MRNAIWPVRLLVDSSSAHEQSELHSPDHELVDNLWHSVHPPWWAVAAKKLRPVARQMKLRHAAALPFLVTVSIILPSLLII